MSKKTKKIVNQGIANRTFLENFIEGKKWSELINVSDLINAAKGNNNSKTFSDFLGEKAKNPGCYKWWAKKEDIEKILSLILYNDEKHKNIFSETDFKQIFKTNKENFYCIYVGKANHLYDRLRDHAKKAEQSTLRRTICSLSCDPDAPNSLETINNTIDNWLNNFKVQYFPLSESERIKEKRGNQTFYKLNDAKHELSLLDLEYFFINEDFHILNVEENHFVDYTKKKGIQIGTETVQVIENIQNALSEKKQKWPKKKIIEIKNKT